MKYIIILLTLIPFNVPAQNWHLSQFSAHPTLISPAFTGVVPGPYRASATFRTQWGGSTAFRSIVLSADAKVLSQKIPEGNSLGIGFGIVNDNSMEGSIRNSSIHLGTAYNIVLNEEGSQSVGIGFQGIYNQLSIDYSRLTFESQLTANGFDISIPVGETLAAGTRSSFNVSAGADYKLDLPDRSFILGFGMYNVLRQSESMTFSEYQFPVRYSFVAAGDLDVGEAGTLSASLNYQQVKKINETTFGASYGLQLGDDKKQVVSLGLWHRWKDAIIPYFGFQLEGLRAGLSYDYTISRLKTGSQSRNAFELNLMYVRPDLSALRKAIPWY